VPAPSGSRAISIVTTGVRSAAERARIVRLLVDRVDVRAEGAAVRLRLDGLGSLVRDLTAQSPEAGRAAA
jgi:hypothetical protein